MTSIRGDEGAPDAYMGVGTELAEMRRAVHILEVQRDIYRLLIELLPLTTVGVLDEKLRWVNVFGEWPQQHDLSSAQLAGEDFGERMSVPDAELMRGVYESARTARVHQEMQSSSGRWLEIDAIPMIGPGGEQLVLSVSHDITARRDADMERQQFMAALQVSEDSFRTAFDGAPIGIALTTAEEWDAERFLRVNNAFGRTLGRDPAEIVGQLVADLTYPDDRNIVDEHPVDDTWHVRKRFLHSSGRPVWVKLFHSVVRDADGRALYLINHAEDITTFKESERALFEALERQRAATEGLRGIDRIRTEVVSTISHELRTPLTSIGGYLEMLSDGDAGRLNDEQQRMIDVASRNADRLALIVDDLLTLAKSDASELDGDRSVIDVTDLLASAAESVLPVIDARHQEIQIAEIEHGVLIGGDSVQLDRAVVNLLTNASKFSPEGARIHVLTHVREGEVHIAVSDNGVGVAVDEQDKLFDRFFRATNSLDNAVAGSGLGLAIVKSIVERHRGRVTVESVPGQGSTFTLILPTAAVAVAVS